MHLSTPIRDEQTRKMLLSPTNGFCIDESTDVSHTSEMIIYTQYVDVENDFHITLEYFEMVACPGGSAEALYNTVTTAVKNRHKQLFDKWMAFGSDGPSVMVGSKNSVVQRLKVVKPWLIDQHCVGHREPLAAKDAFDSIAHCSKLDEVVHACGSFYSHSNERRIELRDIAVRNQEDATQIDMACNTRWLANGMATDSIVEKYESVIEQHAINRTATMTSEGLFRKLTDWNIFGGLLNISDVLAQLTIMSKTFQKTKVPLDGHTVRKAVDDLKAAMRRYNETDSSGKPLFGKNLTKFVNKIAHKAAYSTDPKDFTYGGGQDGAEGGYVISFSSSKRNFIENFAKQLATAVIERIDERFPLADIAIAFDIFDRRRFPVAAATAVRKNLSAKPVASRSDDDKAELKVSSRVCLTAVLETHLFVWHVTGTRRLWSQ
jgi:hypothetical protein